jgi:hypothetical protein
MDIRPGKITPYMTAETALIAFFFKQHGELAVMGQVTVIAPPLCNRFVHGNIIKLRL